MAKAKMVQLRNPKSGLYVRINRETGTIFHKKSAGPFKGIVIAKRKDQGKEGG